MASQLPATTDLVDLHIHVGGAVAPHILWQIAQDHGFKLPVKDYWEFCDLITADPDRVKSLDDYVAIMHEWTERIQSSPAAIELSVYEIMGKEYRSSRVSHIELRFNPMKRNLGGERDLDHIIAAAIRGMERACLAYGITAGYASPIGVRDGVRVVADRSLEGAPNLVAGANRPGWHRRHVNLGRDWQAEIVTRSRFPQFDYYAVQPGDQHADTVVLGGYAIPDISRLTAADSSPGRPPSWSIGRNSWETVVLTYSSVFERELYRLISAQIEEMKEQLSIGLTVASIETYREKVGIITGLRKALELFEDANDIAEKRERGL